MCWTARRNASRSVGLLRINWPRIPSESSVNRSPIMSPKWGHPVDVTQVSSNRPSTAKDTQLSGASKRRGWRPTLPSTCTGSSPCSASNAGIGLGQEGPPGHRRADCPGFAGATRLAAFRGRLHLRLSMSCGRGPIGDGRCRSFRPFPRGPGGSRLTQIKRESIKRVRPVRKCTLSAIAPRDGHRHFIMRTWRDSRSGRTLGIGNMKRVVIAMGLALTMGLPAVFVFAAPAGPPGAVEAIRIAIDAYIYAYPLVTFDIHAPLDDQRRPSRHGRQAPMGQFAPDAQLPRGGRSLLSRRPMPIRFTRSLARRLEGAVGPEHSRHEGSLLPRSRCSTAGPTCSRFRQAHDRRRKAQTYAITGPGLVGHAARRRHASTSRPPPWCGCSGASTAPARRRTTRPCTRCRIRFSAVPLSAYGKPYTPPAGAVDPFDRHEDGPAQPGQCPGRRRRISSSSPTCMKTNPPAAAGRADGGAARQDRPRAGAGLRCLQARSRDREAIAPCRSSRWTGSVRTSRESSSHRRRPTAGCSSPRGRASTAPTTCERAMINRLGLGCEPPAGCGLSDLAEGRQVCSTVQRRRSKYVMHFDKGEMPPANAFWSITMYDERLLLRAPIRSTATTVSPRDKPEDQRGRLGGPVLPGAIAGQGQGGKLAARAAGQVRPDDADLRAQGRRRRSSTAPGSRPRCGQCRRRSDIRCGRQRESSVPARATPSQAAEVPDATSTTAGNTTWNRTTRRRARGPC